MKLWNRLSRHSLSVCVLFLFVSGMAQAQNLLHGLNFRTVADGVPEPLTAEPGNPLRGRELVATRQTSLCLLCHAAPIENERFQGNLAPNLSGSGLRLTPAQLRLRMIDSRLINPDSIMPPYSDTGALNRVGQNWKGKPILSAQQIEDVVAYLSSLKD